LIFSAGPDAVNHYERLKVSQDAPAEVIRAAYRTLAAKLHPDRQYAGEDAAHNEMAALNAAYEVLIDPKSRREYDATLLAPSPLAGGAFAPPPSTFGAAASTSDASGAASTRVDLNWAPPGVASTAQPLWPPTRRMKLIGGSVLAVIILATAGVSWQFMGQRKMEQAMSRQYASQPAAASVSGDPALELPPQVADLGAAAKAPAGARRPSVDELARMSDEELLEILPTLDADSPVPPAVASRLGRSGNKATASSRGRHPLDGAPLNLRTESQLVDPLAPEVPPASAMRR
jgi:curved DNA-binding protein CbpA